MYIFWTLSFTSLVALILHYIYRRLKKPFRYWDERGVRCVPGIPVIGSLYDNFTQVLHDLQVKRYKKYGRVFGFYEAERPVISVAEPELLKNILVKDFQMFMNRRDVSSGDPLLDNMISILKGERWKRVRTIITPAFASGKIKKMTSIMSDATTNLSKTFEKYAATGEPFDCKKVFGTFTMAVIARAAYGTKIDAQSDPDNEFLKHARMNSQRNMSWRVMLFFINPKILKFLGLKTFTSNATLFFRDVSLRIVKHRRETGQKQNDFLQLMMDATDEAENSDAASPNEPHEDDSEKAINDLCHDHQNKQLFKPSKKYKSLSMDELVAQCVIFFLAGHDTSASALCFASYLLALNPECQEKLISEIDGVLKENEGKLTYDALQNMKYLENVIWETLRLFPPAIEIERKAEQDYVLGSTGITIPKGMVVKVPVFAMHRDPEFYEDPEKFDPNRFTPEEKERRHPYTYLPFGAGPRNCVGMRFALIEVKLCLASLLSKFRFKRCPETKDRVEFYGGQGLLQPKGVFVRIEKRTDCVDCVQ